MGLPDCNSTKRCNRYPVCLPSRGDEHIRTERNKRGGTLQKQLRYMQ